MTQPRDCSAYWVGRERELVRAEGVGRAIRNPYVRSRLFELIFFFAIDEDVAYLIVEDEFRWGHRVCFLSAEDDEEIGGWAYARRLVEENR